MIIEWSPKNVNSYSVQSRLSRQGKTIEEVLSGTDSSETILCLARNSCFLKTVLIPPASRADQEVLIKNMLGNLFPVPESELAYDFITYPPLENEMPVTLVAAVKNEILAQVTHECEHAGILPKQYTIASLASASLLKDLHLTAGAVIQKNDRGLEIDIIHDGVLRYSRFSTNYLSIDNEIERTFSAAELPISRIISVEDAFQPAEFQQSEPLIASFANSDIAQLPISLRFTSLKTEEATTKQNRSIRNAAFALVGSLVVLGLTITTYVADQRASTVAIASSEKELGLLTDHEKTIEKSYSLISPDEDVLNRAFRPAQTLTDVLTAISNDVPEKVWLKSFNLQRGNEVVVQGTALNSQAVTSFVKNLSSEDRLRDVKLLYANNSLLSKTPVIEFSVSGFPVGNLPLVDKKVNGVAATPAGTGA